MTAQVVHLAVFDGRHAVVVGRSDPQGDPGTRAFFESAPAHCTSVGKAILAYQQETSLERFIAGGPAQFTDMTLADVPARLRDLDLTRERGYAVEEGEHQPGSRCSGGPIQRQRDQPGAGLSLTFRNSEYKSDNLLTA